MTTTLMTSGASLAGVIIALAAVGFVLYLWTWIRFVATPEPSARATRTRSRAGCAASA